MSASPCSRLKRTKPAGYASTYGFTIAWIVSCEVGVVGSLVSSVTRLRDRTGEGRRVDVRRDLSGLARLDHLVEVGDGATAARLGGDDLKIGVAGVLDDERPVELLALGNRAVVFDRLDDGEARRLLRLPSLPRRHRSSWPSLAHQRRRKWPRVSATRTAIMMMRIRFDDMDKILLG